MLTTFFLTATAAITGKLLFVALFISFYCKRLGAGGQTWLFLVFFLIVVFVVPLFIFHFLTSRPPFHHLLRLNHLLPPPPLLPCSLLILRCGGELMQQATTL